ncbi:hypothetical protein [Rickettsia helvetica]|uniref:hypothetical protein n=1 Tax=Rickettsia helvetica TaxID=35789 RepID=UPI00030ECBB5|nr:hypothetical protein [Rickettsia helvetica]
MPLPQVYIVTSVQGQTNLTLQLKTSFQFKHPSWAEVKAFNIADTQLLNFATDTSPPALLYSDKVMDIQPVENSINFGGPNATYDVSNESPNPAKFTASFKLVPANDLDGKLGVHVATGSRIISLNAGVAVTEQEGQ